MSTPLKERLANLYARGKALALAHWPPATALIVGFLIGKWVGC